MTYREYSYQNASFVLWIKEMAVSVGLQLAEIEVLSVTGRGSKLRKAIRKFLRSHDNYTYFLFRAINQRKLLNNFPPEKILSEADRINPFVSIQETAYATLLPLAPGRFRPIVAFGPFKLARQKLVASLLRAVHSPHPDQFLFRGGVPAALRAVDAAYRDGFMYGGEADVIEFFPHIRHREGIRSLLKPVPGTVTDHVIWTDTRTVRLARSYGSSLQGDCGRPSLRGLVGVAQGSATSSWVGEIVMAALLRRLPEDVRCVAYADNVLILGRTEQAVATGLQTLCNCCSDDHHTTGPLRIRTRDIVSMGHGITFLGHDGLLTGDGCLRWEPKREKLAYFYRLVDEPNADPSEVSRAIHRLRQTRRGYPAWLQGDDIVQQLIAGFYAKRFYVRTDRISRSCDLWNVYECWEKLGWHFDPYEFLPEVRDEFASERIALRDALFELHARRHGQRDEEEG